jgi:hypothetical protein
MLGREVALPLWRRWFDLLLFTIAGVFACTSFTSDLLLAFDVPLTASSETYLARAFFTLYASDGDPLLVENPLFVRVAAAISVFLFGPFYVTLCYALWRRQNWIRIPALMYAAAALYCMVIVLGVNLFGDYTPQNPAKFYAANLPYVIFPLMVIYRMRRASPFRNTLLAGLVKTTRNQDIIGGE